MSMAGYWSLSGRKRMRGCRFDQAVDAFFDALFPGHLPILVR
jgi:hypothetical protein